MVGVVGCESALLAHVELLIDQHPQVLLLRAFLWVYSGLNALTCFSRNKREEDKVCFQ